MNNIQQFESVDPKIWEAGKMILGPKHKPVERMAIYQPTTQDLLTDPKDILTTRLKVGILTKDPSPTRGERTRTRQKEKTTYMTV